MLTVGFSWRMDHKSKPMGRERACMGGTTGVLLNLFDTVLHPWGREILESKLKKSVSRKCLHCIMQYSGWRWEFPEASNSGPGCTPLRAEQMGADEQTYCRSANCRTTVQYHFRNSTVHCSAPGAQNRLGSRTPPLRPILFVHPT